MARAFSNALSASLAEDAWIAWAFPSAINASPHLMPSCSNRRSASPAISCRRPGAPPKNDWSSNSDRVGLSVTMYFHIERSVCDSCTAANALLDHLVHTHEHRHRHVESERLRSLEIDDEFNLH